MKICTNCNHILRNEETTCPYCTMPLNGADNVQPFSEAEAAEIDIVDEIDYATATLELPMGYLEDDAMVLTDSIDTPSRDAYDFPEEEPQPEEEGEPSFDYVPEQPQEPEGDLELEVRELSQQDDEMRGDGANIIGKLGITLLVVLIAGLFIFAVNCLVKYMKGPTPSDSVIMLEYVSGTWLSEPFIFAEDTSHSFVEEFTIYKDGSFTLRHLIPDSRNENGWQDGSWEEDYRISGSVEILVEERCIIMKYSEFGIDYYFDRYILETEDDRLVLREFYDDAATKSYDVIYSRIGEAQDSPVVPEHAQDAA